MIRRLRFLMLVLLVTGIAWHAGANPSDQVPGSYTFYDRALDHETDDPNNHSGHGQAELIEHDGNVELHEWGNGSAHALRFTPEKIGDSISFRIHIAKVDWNKALLVQTVDANFRSGGIYQLLVDDELVGPQHDNSTRDKWQHGEWPIEAGNYKITYRYVGQNPKFASSVLSLIRLEIG